MAARPCEAGRPSTVAGIRLKGLVWNAGGLVGLSAPVRIGPGAAPAGTTATAVTAAVTAAAGVAEVLVEPGEVVAVCAAAEVGAALADVLVGLLPPAAGSVWVAGRPAYTVAGRPNPRLVALIPAGGALLPHLSVARNIAFGDRFHPDRGARDSQVIALAQLFRVAGVLRLHPHRLSPAQRLGVAAARALGSDPYAVVVEDRAGQPDCAAIVAALAQRDRAVIVITDDAGRAEPLTDRVYRAGPLPSAPEPEPALEPVGSGAAPRPPAGPVPEGRRNADLA